MSDDEWPPACCLCGTQTVAADKPGTARCPNCGGLVDYCRPDVARKRAMAGYSQDQLRATAHTAPLSSLCRAAIALSEFNKAGRKFRVHLMRFLEANDVLVVDLTREEYQVYLEDLVFPCQPPRKYWPRKHM